MKTTHISYLISLKVYALSESLGNGGGESGMPNGDVVPRNGEQLVCKDGSESVQLQAAQTSLPGLNGLEHTEPLSPRQEPVNMRPYAGLNRYQTLKLYLWKFVVYKSRKKKNNLFLCHANSSFTAYLLYTLDHKAVQAHENKTWAFHTDCVGFSS